MATEENGARSPYDDGVEKLKHKLYSRENKDRSLSDIRTPLNPERPEAPVAWSRSEEEDIPLPKKPPLAQFEVKNRMSLAAKFLLGSVAFFVLAAAAAAYMFFGGGNIISPQNIDLQIVAPSLIDSGKEADFQIIIKNRNASALTLVDLVIDYPNGTRDPNDASKTLQHIRQSIGTINPGQQIKQTTSALLYGSEGASQKVSVTLEYSLAGSNAVFQKSSEADVTIGSSPVSLSVSAPSEAIAGETFPMDVTVQSNATTPLSGVVVQAQYPFGYSVASSQPQATAGGTFWRLGDMAPGSSQTIHIVGSIDGQDGDERVFKFLAGSNADQTDTTVKVPLLSIPQTLTVRKPFISGQISVNGQSGKGVSVDPGKALQGTVIWQNNLSTAVSNVQLTLSFSGPALDTNSISSATGFYQSQTHTITWTRDQEPSLASVPPGGSGTLQFSFASLPPGAGNVLITNPTITVTLAVSGQRDGNGNVPENISSAAQTQVTLASMLSLSAQALHFTGPFQNSGPMPPRAEQDTSYTIVWTVKNSSNTIANASVSTVLPPYTRYISSAASGISYDDGSRTVTWTLGDLQAGVGYSVPQKQASFQVVLNPSTSQTGSTPSLTGAVTLSGQDRFAQVAVQSQAQAPTTELTESGFTSGMGVVLPK